MLSINKILPEVKMQNRLFFKQASITVMVSLLLGTIFSVGQIFFDLKREKFAIEQKMSQVLSLTQSSAAEAAFTLDPNVSQNVVNGIIKQAFIIEVTITSDFNEILAKAKKEKTAGSKAILAESILGESITMAIDLYVPKRSKSIGRLDIFADSYQIAENFINRSVTVILIGFVKKFASFNNTCCHILFYPYQPHFVPYTATS